jgi:hypothetical protein
MAATTRLRHFVALALVSLLVLSACGGGEEEEKKTSDEPEVVVPTGDVDVPAGVKLTPPGAELKFGQKATVAYEPNPKRSSVLRLTVRSVTRGSIRDLSMYNLDDRLKASVPYYVRVRVANVGKGDLGKTPIPLWAVDTRDTLIQASSFTNTFKRCPSRPLPPSFGPKARTTECLVYLVPDRGKLTGVSYRPLQAYAPIEWTGKIITKKAQKKTQQKAQKKAQKKKQQKGKKKN